MHCWVGDYVGSPPVQLIIYLDMYKVRMEIVYQVLFMHLSADELNPHMHLFRCRNTLHYYISIYYGCPKASLNL